mgnify:CR=1 FL=1
MGLRINEEVQHGTLVLPDSLFVLITKQRTLKMQESSIVDFRYLAVNIDYGLLYNQSSTSNNGTKYVSQQSRKNSFVIEGLKCNVIVDVLKFWWRIKYII